MSIQKALIFQVALILSLVSEQTCCAQNISPSMVLGRAAADYGEIAEVPISIDTGGQIVQGWGLGVKHQTSHAQFIGVELTDLSLTSACLPLSEFIQVETSYEGWSTGVLLSGVDCTSLPAGSQQNTVISAMYRVYGGGGTLSKLEFSSSQFSNPNSPPCYFLVNGQLVLPEFNHGVLKTNVAVGECPGSYVLETRPWVNNTTNGGTSISVDQWIGARFQVTEETKIIELGSHIKASLGNDRSLFLALVPLDPSTNFPATSDLSDHLWAEAFQAPYNYDCFANYPCQVGDTSFSVDIELSPGGYALVAGSGQFGATGQGYVPINNTDKIGIIRGPNWIDIGGINNPRFFVLGYPVSSVGDDCNQNQILDLCESETDGMADCDSNGLIDICEIAESSSVDLDCNANGLLDSCDTVVAPELDCDGNLQIDSCELEAGAGDCNQNLILDLCEVDTDLDGTIDDCDPDLDGDGIANECDVDYVAGEDCDSNGVLDLCDILAQENDVNQNGVVDLCESFKRGDASADGVINIGDVVVGLNWVFIGSELLCDDAFDVNDDSLIDIADAIFLLSAMFEGGVVPAMPFPNCGLDQSVDALSCDTYMGCVP